MVENLNNKQTKIVATISDLNCSVDFLTELYKSGMNVVRLNTAHQTFEDTLKVIENVRKVSDKIALLVDTKGPEVRTSKTESEIFLKSGEVIQVKSDNFDEYSTNKVIQVSYGDFVKDVPEGSEILIDDGELGLKVIKKTSTYLECKVQNDGSFKSKKSVNVPGVSLHLPSLTEKDKEYVEFSVKHGVDFIAHSFIRGKKDLDEVQKILDKHKSDIKIISKIENQEGVDNIDEILDNCYGIMIARGDLGVELPAEEIPIIQKMLIRKCMEAHKPVITATQMLHTMIKNPRPTRAEVSDIANAVLDGTDALMLSGETAYGKYPVKAVKSMARIAKRVEANMGNALDDVKLNVKDTKRSFLARAAVEAVHEMDIKAIVVNTLSGYSARVASSYRGQTPIYAQTFSPIISRILALSYGVFPNHMKKPKTMDAVLRNAFKALTEGKPLKKENEVVVLGIADPALENATTNFLEICDMSDYL